MRERPKLAGKRPNESDGDQGSQAARQRGRELIAQRGPGAAEARAEQLRNKRRLNGIQEGVAPGQSHDDRQQDVRGLPRLQEGEEGDGEQNQHDAAGQVGPAPRPAVGQIAVQGNRDELHQRHVSPPTT